MIVTETPGSWSCARSVSKSAPRSGCTRLLRFSGRFIVMRRTRSTGSSTMITSFDIGAPWSLRLRRLRASLDDLGERADEGRRCDEDGVIHNPEPVRRAARTDHNGRVLDEPEPALPDDAATTRRERVKGWIHGRQEKLE